MLSYELLDAIADAVVPCLAVLWLGHGLALLLRKNYRVAAGQFVLGVGLLLVAYGLMWLDASTGSFASIGLDYSTHTAVAAALVVVLAFHFSGWRFGGALLLLGYMLLMLYQRYHSIADMLTTLGVLALPFYLLARVSAQYLRKYSAQPS